MGMQTAVSLLTAGGVFEGCPVCSASIEAVVLTWAKLSMASDFCDLSG